MGQPSRMLSEGAKDARVAAGGWLRKLREARGLSQRELATLVGIEYYTFIAQIESGRGRIPPERYDAWARALGVDLREFVKEMLWYYEPTTWRALFDSEESRGSGREGVTEAGL